ncbi:MAG: hypothetical protein ACOYJB_09280 [Christensenellaceae bacterium]|jgi:hypothetical protein
MEKVEFRYTPLPLQIGVWGSLAALVILVFRVAVRPMYDRFDSLSSPAEVLVICLVCVAIMAAAMIVPLIIAMRVTDWKGAAILEDDCVHICFRSKKITLAYKDIEKMQCNPLPTRGPRIMEPLFRLQIKAAGQTVALVSSSKESWENRKSKAMPQMIRVYRAILTHTTL